MTGSHICITFFPGRACIVVNDRLLAIGGQEGDFMPKPNSPIFKCSRRHEVYQHHFCLPQNVFDVFVSYSWIVKLS